MKELRGTGIALVTPFTLAGEVDYAALSRLMDHYMENGVDYLVVLEQPQRLQHFPNMNSAKLRERCRNQCG